MEADDDGFGMEVGDDVEDVSQLEIVSWRAQRVTVWVGLPLQRWKIDEH